MTVHLVEDSERERETLRGLLEKSWDEDSSIKPPRVREWEFLWDLLEGEELAAGDIVIADLYPTQYWEKAPAPKPEYKKPLPEAPTNFYSAAIDMVTRFMRETVGRGAHLMALTYVPNYIEKELHVPVAATRLRSFLEGEKFPILEKQEKYQDLECFERAVGWANGKLGK